MNASNCTEHKVRKELIESTITMNNDSIIHLSAAADFNLLSSSSLLMYFVGRLALILHIDICIYIEMSFTCLDIYKCVNAHYIHLFCGSNEINGSVQKWMRNLVRLYVLFGIKRG